MPREQNVVVRLRGHKRGETEKTCVLPPIGMNPPRSAYNLS